MMRLTPQQSECPRITWDLRLQPAALEQAFWNDNADRLLRNDFNLVTRFHLVGLAAFTLSLYRQLGREDYIRSFWHFWLTYIVWFGLMKLAPGFYKRHRLAVVWLMRLSVLCTTERSMATASVKMDKIAVHPERPALTLLLKAVLPSNAFHHFLESNALLVPYLHNVALMMAKAIVVLTGTYMQALIAFANTPSYLQVVAWVNSRWRALLSTPLTFDITPDKTLEGRSTAVLLGLTTLHITPVFLACYVLYINQLVAVRLWLKDKVAAALQQPQQQGGYTGSGDLVLIGDKYVSTEQLVALHDRPGAVQALLNAVVTGRDAALSKAAVVGIHAVFVGLLCQVALVCSEVFVYRLFPAMIGGSGYWMQQFYPLLPDGLPNGFS